MLRSQDADRKKRKQIQRSKVKIIQKMLMITVDMVNEILKNKRYKLQYSENIPSELDSNLGTNDCYGYETSRDKILLGFIAVIDKNIEKIVSLLFLSYDKDFDFIVFSFGCTATEYRKRGLSTITRIPVILMVLEHPDLVTGIVNASISPKGAPVRLTNLGKVQEPLSKSLLLNKLNFSFFQKDAMIPFPFSANNLKARCVDCQEFIKKSKANYEAFLAKNSKFPFDNNKNSKHYDNFLFVKGAHPETNLTLEDLPNLILTLSKYLKHE